MAANTAECLSSAETIAFLETGNLSLLIGSDDDDFLHTFGDTGFEEQRNIVDDDGIAILSSRLSGQPTLLSGHARMDEPFKHPPFRRMTEDNCSEGLSVDRSVRVQDGFPKPTNDVLPGRFARLDHRFRQCIGIDDNGPALLEHSCDGTFSGRNTSGEADQDHSGGAYHA